MERTETAARRVVRRMRERPDQQLVGLMISDRQAGEPTIYFLAPDIDRPSGGSRVIYRHADILRSVGMRSVVLHRRNGFRYTWFENETVVSSVEACSIGPRDLLVVSEPDVALLVRSWAKTDRFPRHVILNQSGPYLTWQGDSTFIQTHYSSANRPEAIIATSAYIADFARVAFPHISVERVRLSVDPNRFFPQDKEPPRQIAFVKREIPLKQSDDGETVLRILQNTGVLRGWEMFAISNLRENEVAAAMRNSRIFLALSAREGFGLPPLEAMASGCYVIGYHGNGGREYMRDQFSRPVEAGDIVGLASELESVIEAESDEAGWLRERGLAASDFAHTHYSPAVEKEDVVRAYSRVLASY